jgi:hypothetical protein
LEVSVKLIINNADIKMDWKYVSYTDNTGKYIIPIEPMYQESDIMYLPVNQEDYKEIIETIRSIPWNRNLVYEQAKYELKGIDRSALEFEEGSLESTEAGKEFAALGMFDPGFEMEPEKVHELWCVMEKRFAESAAGKVTIVSNSIIAGSVFEKVSIPALMSNDKAFLFFVEK